MKAVCQKDPNHHEFVTVAHVTEYWLVNADGHFIDTTDTPGETTCGPEAGNLWICDECGSDATVTP